MLEDFKHVQLKFNHPDDVLKLKWRVFEREMGFCTKVSKLHMQGEILEKIKKIYSYVDNIPCHTLEEKKNRDILLEYWIEDVKNRGFLHQQTQKKDLLK